MSLSINSMVTLNNGVEMPIFGLGTFRMGQGEVTRRSVREALQAGYRLIDTASAYGNEEDIGAAVAESGIARQEIFLTTKVWIDEQGFEETQRACRQSLARLQTDYVDLYLIHWPAPGHWQEAWRAMMLLQQQGLCRAIGVSNFHIHHLEELGGLSDMPPAVNQVEFSPFLYRKELLDYCQGHNIVVESYSTLTRGAKLKHPVLTGIAAAHSKTPAQVVIRWNLQHGVTAIPMSTNPAHIRENADVFDFTLTDAEMKAIDGLNENYSIVNPAWKAQFE